jgi:predicted O-linked N-acetylglucosamine transferase (SPINDLY family)
MADQSSQIMLGQAVRLHQEGRLGEAEGLYRQVLAKNPDEADALHLLGILLSQANRAGEAVELLQRAAGLAPQSADVLSNLGIALSQCGRNAEAADRYRAALKLRPDHANAIINLGNLLEKDGKLEEAIPFLRKAADSQPRNLEVWEKLGDALRRSGRGEEALRVFEHVVKLAPQRAEVQNYMGLTLAALGREDLAIAALEKAIRLKPDYADPHNNLGLLLGGRGRNQEAIEEFQTAIRLRPNFPAAYNNLGYAYGESERFDEAVEAFRKSLSAGPEEFHAMVGLATALKLRGDLDEAIALYRKAAAKSSESADEVQNLLGAAEKNFGQVEEAVAAFRAATEINPANPSATSNLVLTLCYDPRLSATQLLKEHREWDRRHARPLRDSIRPHGNSRDPDRRLKIGYVSADLRQHAASFCVVPLLSHHDHSRFEIICYSSGKKSDAVTERLKGMADGWRDCQAMSDEEMAEQIRADGIDIAVDLSMHTWGNRLLALARKPAPVQACWLAIAGTTGLEAMDYRLTDPYLDPPGTHEDWYAEKSVRLADCFWCYDPLTDLPLPHPTAALENGFFTFGCLNNFCKVNDVVLSLWSKVLAAVPGSRLLLNCPEGSARERVREGLGVDAERLIFVARQPRPLYLETYRRIDLCLDTLPYNGAITSLESFWMGVPVLSLLGQSVVGRAGWSLLNNLGLPELCAQSEERFVELAVQWAGDLAGVAKLHETMRERLRRSPLMDGGRFARSVEEAYRGMWRNWCEAKP